MNILKFLHSTQLHSIISIFELHKLQNLWNFVNQFSNNDEIRSAPTSIIQCETIVDNRKSSLNRILAEHHPILSWVVRFSSHFSLLSAACARHGKILGAAVKPIFRLSNVRARLFPVSRRLSMALTQFSSPFRSLMTCMRVCLRYPQCCCFFVWWISTKVKSILSKRINQRGKKPTGKSCRCWDYALGDKTRRSEKGKVSRARRNKIKTKNSAEQQEMPYKNVNWSCCCWEQNVIFSFSSIQRSHSRRSAMIRSKKKWIVKKKKVCVVVFFVCVFNLHKKSRIVRFCEILKGAHKAKRAAKKAKESEKVIKLKIIQ